MYLFLNIDNRVFQTEITPAIYYLKDKEIFGTRKMIRQK